MPGIEILFLVSALAAFARAFDETRLGTAFDVILLSAVWMHVPPGERARAFRKLINVLKPGGLTAVTLREGPAEPARGFHPVSAHEIERLARDYGAFVEHVDTAPDRGGRRGVRWTHIAVRLPDDGTGALPLLRHIILSDAKSSTYKLALLRTLSRIADGAAGMSRDAGESHVSVPLGLVALTWVRLFHPLIRGDFPQAPLLPDGRGLSFVRHAFREILKLPAGDLRIGWSEPSRDVQLARGRTLELIERGREMRCAWSGKRLTTANLDIDHCFPWSAWPCSDLWNLLPVRRDVNSRKGARLPDAVTLQSAAERIIEWWHEGYRQAENPRTIWTPTPEDAMSFRTMNESAKSLRSSSRNGWAASGVGGSTRLRMRRRVRCVTFGASVRECRKRRDGPCSKTSWSGWCH